METLDYVVDGSTVLYNGGSQPHLQNLLLLMEELERRGARFEVYCDASIRHKVDDKKQYEKLVREGKIVQCPAGTQADKWILKRAEATGAKIITLDRYDDLAVDFPFVVEPGRRVPFMIRGNQVMLDEPQDDPVSKGERIQKGLTVKMGGSMEEAAFSIVSTALGLGIFLFAWWGCALPAVVGSTNPLSFVVFATMLATSCFLLRTFGGVAGKWTGLIVILLGLYLLFVGGQVSLKEMAPVKEMTKPFLLRMLYPASCIYAGAALAKHRGKG
ncbi:MAG: hypothetical protein QW356_04925 [Candidatus Hadarchaeales archaeon]